METITREVSARQLRSELAAITNEAAYARGRIALHRYGSIVAVLIGVDDFERLLRLESAPGALLDEETVDEMAQRWLREGEATRRAESAEQRAEWADQRAELAKQRADEETARADLAERRAAELQLRAEVAEHRAAAAERRAVAEQPTG